MTPSWKIVLIASLVVLIATPLGIELLRSLLHRRREAKHGMGGTRDVAFYGTIVGLLALAGIVISGIVGWRSGSRSAQSRSFSAEPSFWVWHRSSPLAADELNGLGKAGVTRLYWQIVEFRRDGAEWNPYPLAKRESLPDLATVVPVIRLAPDLKLFERPAAAEQLGRWLRQWAGDRPLTTVQIDYDCPAGLLDRYATFLKALKTEAGVTTISATALASWVDAPLFPRLTGSVDELVPMFYDLEADLPEKVMAGNPVPMLSSATTRWIARWKSCGIPWRAGLPNFQRLTLFDASGKSLGHLRGWSPGALLRCNVIQRTELSIDGLVRFQVTDPGELSGTSLVPGQVLFWRAPDEAGLRASIAAAREAGSSGVTWFALPGPGLPASHSPSHLGALAEGRALAPELKLEQAEKGSVTLRNNGPGDLSFRPDQAAYRLELAAPAAGNFGEGDAGGFLKLESGVTPKYSRKIWLIFPSLHVEEGIASGDDLWHRQTGDSVMWSVQGGALTPTP